MTRQPNDRTNSPQKDSEAGAIAFGPRPLGASDVFDRSMAEFAEAYADQNERDYQALKDAAASGRVVAKTGV